MCFRLYPCQIYELLTLVMVTQEVRTTRRHGNKQGSLESMIPYWKMVSLCGLTRLTLYVFVSDSDVCVCHILTMLISSKLGSYLRTRSPKETYLGMKSSTTIYPWFAFARSMQLDFLKAVGTRSSIFVSG